MYIFPLFLNDTSAGHRGRTCHEPDYIFQLAIWFPTFIHSFFFFEKDLEQIIMGHWMKRPSSFSTHIKRHANSWESNGTNAQRFFNFDSPEREIREKTHTHTQTDKQEEEKRKTFFLLLIVTDGNNNLQLRKEWVRSGPVTLERGSTHRAGQLLAAVRYPPSPLSSKFSSHAIDRQFFGWRRAASKYYTMASQHTHTHARWGQKKGAMTGQIHARLVAHTSLCNPSRHSEGRNRREKKQQQEKKKKEEAKANHRLFNALLPFPFSLSHEHHTTSLNFKSNRRFRPRQKLFFFLLPSDGKLNDGRNFFIFESFFRVDEIERHYANRPRTRQGEIQFELKKKKKRQN